MPIKIPEEPPAGYIELTEDEYLAREAEAEYNSEYRQGRVFAMSGGTFPHALIATNCSSAIHQQLTGKPCRVVAGNMRAKVAAAGLYTYPDVAVICGRPVFDQKDKNSIVNPTVILEVLSKSTEAYDRGEKFAYYKKLDSLREYILVSQDRIQVERYTRETLGEWPLTRFQSADDTLELSSIQCRVALRDVYAKVDFQGNDSEDPR